MAARRPPAAPRARGRARGAEPSLADLAARVGSDETRLGRTIVRINTIESTSPLSAGDHVDNASLPAALVPSEPLSPAKAYEDQEVRDRIRAAIATLPQRERKVIGLYYYAEATMKQIGVEIGVNESRVSQLHARAVQRLRKALGADSQAAEPIGSAILSFQHTMRKLRMAKAAAAPFVGDGQEPATPPQPAVVLQYRTPPQKTAAGAPRRRTTIRPEPAVAAAR
jgi:RNA polymerase sigma factor (sigma-70 family)